MAEPFDVVGKSTPKRDGPEKVTGRTRYLHDLERLGHRQNFTASLCSPNTLRMA